MLASFNVVQGSMEGTLYFSPIHSQRGATEPAYSPLLSFCCLCCHADPL